MPEILLREGFDLKTFFKKCVYAGGVHAECAGGRTVSMKHFTAGLGQEIKWSYLCRRLATLDPIHYHELYSELFHMKSTLKRLCLHLNHRINPVFEKMIEFPLLVTVLQLQFLQHQFYFLVSIHNSVLELGDLA